MRDSYWLILVFLFACFLFESVASADETPEPSPFDSRIQSVVYNSGDVVVVAARSGRGVRIVFSPNEKILDVASGFTEGWELVERGNILFLKAKSLQGEGGVALSPQAERWNTNLMVTTNLHLYDFDLRLVGAAEGIAYRIEFQYPAEEKAKAQAKATEKKSLDKLSRKMPPKNWQYSLQASKNATSIAPSLAYDDGNFTYLRFPNNRDFPVAFLVAADGSESLVNSHVDGDTLVIHRVAPQFVLRFGKAVVTVFNDSFDPDGIIPANGTTAPGAQRELKETK
jgi:P-type conjugative transfer protein VirB9